jgi:hypothetical protein
MAAVPYAHIVANLLRKKHPKGTDIALAPNPKDIVRYLTLTPEYLLNISQIWANFNKSTSELIRNKFFGSLFLVLVCFFNTIPLFIISILANLSSV